MRTAALLAALCLVGMGCSPARDAGARPGRGAAGESHEDGGRIPAAEWLQEFLAARFPCRGRRCERACRNEEVFRHGRWRRLDGGDESRGKSLRVANGRLVGSDFGEWGGRVYFSDGTGETRRVAETRHGVRRIEPAPSGAVAITYTTHLGLDRGAIVYFQEIAPGEWRERATLELSGAGLTRWRYDVLYDPGGLLIKWDRPGGATTADGARLVPARGYALTDDGRIVEIPCR